MAKEGQVMDEKKKETRYFVNGEEENTKAESLTVRVILDQAGFQPVEDYTLKSEDPKENYDSHYDREVRIHEDQRFEALHKGPTPTS